jgi:hypothetical protein
MNVHSNGTAAGTVLYNYTPAQAPAWAFVSLFGASTVIHIVMMFPMRAAFFIPLIIGGICKSPPEKSWGQD